jgi:hypothetical protein
VKCQSTFTVSHWNGESTCIIVPAHKNDEAINKYNRKQCYVETFCEIVEAGDTKVGISRVLSTLIKLNPEVYL